MDDMFGVKDAQDFHITSKGKAKPVNRAAKKSIALEHAKEGKPYHPRNFSPNMLSDFKKAEEKREHKKWSVKEKKAYLKKEHARFDER